MFTIEDDFHTLENAIFTGNCGVDRPTRPQKPLQPKFSAPIEDHKAFVSAMEKYNKEEEQYKIVLKEYNDSVKRVEKLWKEKLRKNYTHLSDEKFNKIFAKVWEDEHGSCYGDIRYAFEEMCDFVEGL